jgi:hypothetical protein
MSHIEEKTGQGIVTKSKPLCAESTPGSQKPPIATKWTAISPKKTTLLSVFWRSKEIEIDHKMRGKYLCGTMLKEINMGITQTIIRNIRSRVLLL